MKIDRKKLMDELQTCDKCGKSFKDKDEALAVSFGTMSIEVSGFQSEGCEPYLAVLCKSCGDQMLDDFLKR
jgi:hypothetical protein